MTQEALKLALEALENGDVPTPENAGKNLDAITAIKEALAQPEQEPVKMVAYNCFCGRTMKFESVHGVVAPQRTWVGLTDEEAKKIQTIMTYGNWSFQKIIQTIEAKLKEKNGA